MSTLARRLGDSGSESGENMRAMSEDPAPGGVPERLVQATIKLLAEQGPSAIKARTVASETGLSTMVVYSHFGGIPELIRAVADHGYKELDSAFSQVPVTEDPVADLFVMALTTWRVARANPHLYDLMFGLSTRATYPARAGRPVERTLASLPGRLRAPLGRVRPAGELRPGQAQPDVIAAALWSFVHGYITLELAEHFAEFDDPVQQVLLPMGVTFAVGLGDTRERAQASHEAAVCRYDSIART